MRVILAPDSFKGSLTAAQAAQAMAKGARTVFPAAHTVEIPMADGGEGTLQALIAATQGRIVSATVTGPLGDPVVAQFGLLGNGQTAIIEMAAASGLLLVPRPRLDPLKATTYGTGELIKAALDHGATRFIMAIGGSATNDGGAGMAQALGARLLRLDGSELPWGGAALLELDQINLTGLDPRLAPCEILVACDVDNPMVGPRGASAVYGPQKGASPSMVGVLDRALGRLADLLDPGLRDLPGAGAAGGLGGGLVGFLGAQLRPGIDLVLDAVGLDQHLPGATLVLTGEGRTDGQTLAGKVPLGVARRAALYGVPVVIISGAITPDADSLLTENVVSLLSIVDGPISLEAAMANAPALLERATARALRLMAAGRTFTG